MPDLQILLATYNSSPYLSEQLDSLLAQDRQDFEILIRDGGSTDDTRELIASFQRLHPEKIRMLGSAKADALENFSALLNASSADLVMFCDHDDVWKPDKVSVTLEKYREMENEFGKDTPIMVFTDSEVADDKLDRIFPSMIRFQHLDPFRLTLNRLIVQNVPSGNTMLVNRALLDLALPIPPEAVMHDHWLSLVAVDMGQIGFIDKPTLLYRQHGNNVYGAFHYSLPAMIEKMKLGRSRLRERFEENIRQAAAFGRRYGASRPPQEREMLEALAQWNDLGFWKKRRLLLKYRIFKCGLTRNLFTFMIV